MAKYLFNKYKVAIQYHLDTNLSNLSWATAGRDTIYFSGLAKTFEVKTPVLSTESPFNVLTTFAANDYIQGSSTPGYSFNGLTITKYVSETSGSGTNTVNKFTATVKLLSTKEVAGDLVESNIVAEGGSLPINGKHTDGYWYIQGAKISPNIYMKVNGEQKEYSDGFVKINGVWIAVDEVYVKVNGTWVQS